MHNHKTNINITLSIDTSNLSPPFFGLRGHVWEKPHTIAQRPQQTCINKNIIQILSQISTSPHNNELAANGSRTKINIGAARACHRQNMFVIKCTVKLYNCTTRLHLLLFKRPFQNLPSLHFCLLTYLLTMYLHLLTYLLTIYLFIYLLTPFFIFLTLFTYLLTYLLIIYYLFTCVLFAYLLFIYLFIDLQTYFRTAQRWP